MERGSDKHGRLVDEELKHQTRSLVQGSPVEARADEAREQEGPGDDDPTPDSRLVGGRLQYDGERPTDEELEARAELARHLQPSVFPATPARLRASAEELNAPPWILDALEALPDTTYATTEAVWEALGGSHERRGLA